jgi:hypothetical protein
MAGTVSPVEDILSRQPNLKVLRDPPSLAGQRVRCVMAFHYNPGQAAVTMCKVRAQAWTDPSLNSLWGLLDKEISTVLSETIFDMVKEQCEKGDPERIRAGEVNPWQYLL